MWHIRAEKLNDGRYQVFFPGRSKIVENLKELEKYVQTNGMPKGRYPRFETELLSNGNASETFYSINYGGQIEPDRLTGRILT